MKKIVRILAGLVMGLMCVNGYLFSSCRGRKEMGRPDKVYGERRSIADCVG